MMQEKTFYLENQGTHTSQLIRLAIPQYQRLINLQPILQKIPDYTHKIFKIYNADHNTYIPFTSTTPPMTSPYSVLREYLQLAIIIIKYTDGPNMSNNGSGNSEEKESVQDGDQGNQGEEVERKQRSKERSIREVIDVVRRWRDFHEIAVEGRKRTLLEAAGLVGVSKKSLDDYYYQLRVGEKYEFDFQSHLEDKIGVLRAFIKEKDPQRRIQGKNSKHPKKLKIIEQFAQKLRITDPQSPTHQPIPLQSPPQQSQSPQQPPPSPSPSLSISYSNNNMLYSSFNEPNSVELQYQFKNQSNVDQIFWGAPFNQLSQEKFMDFQKKYYDDFGFNLEEIGDPYLPFLPFTRSHSDKSQKEL